MRRTCLSPPKGGADAEWGSRLRTKRGERAVDSPPSAERFGLGSPSTLCVWGSRGPDKPTLPLEATLRRSRASFSPAGILPLTRLFRARAQLPGGLSWKDTLLPLTRGPRPPLRLQGTSHGGVTLADSTSKASPAFPNPLCWGFRESAPLGERCQLRVVTCGMRSVSLRERGLHTHEALLGEAPLP